SGVAQEYLRLRSRSPPPATTPTCPVLLDRLTLSRDRLPTCEPLCCVGHDKDRVATADGVARSRVARWSAYFSVRPPAGPVQLVPVSTPPKLPALSPRSFTSSPPPHSSDLATQQNKMRCRNAVHGVLCELMSTLPLPPSPIKSPTSPTTPTTSATTGTPPTPPTPETPVYTAPPVRAQRIRRLD
ncbi:proline-rich receptor-like protein kinase PERK8, partial [Spodoptera litura]|uniref:Proline-rich receptor-like protein kinase PERK8 n=1 Tax=Spodoptera litura TaxID=69820 RepID=A0A9J7EVP7_SPOLT